MRYKCLLVANTNEELIDVVENDGDVDEDTIRPHFIITHETGLYFYTRTRNDGLLVYKHMDYEA